MHLNPYSIPPILCGLWNILLGILALRKDPKSKVHQSFAILCFSFAMWLSFYGVLYNLGAENQWVQFWFRISYCGIIYISPSFARYIYEFIDYKHRVLMNTINNIIAVILIFLVLNSNHIVAGLREFYWGPYPAAGKFHPVFLAYFIPSITMPLILLKSELKRIKDPRKLNQAKYVLIAAIISTFACYDFIPNYGKEVYPFGYALITIFLSIITYAIIVHKLLDINIAIKQSIAYSILLAVILIFYLITVLLLERLIREHFGYTSIAVSIFTAFFIGLLFIPLRNRIQYIVDKLFFHRSSAEIAEENRRLMQEAEKMDQLKSVATLASGVAHEIKNPLTAINTFAEQLPKRLNDKEFLKKFSRIVGSEVTRINDLVHNLLDYAKPSPPKRTPTDITRLIDETLELLSNAFVKYNIKIKPDYEPIARVPVSIDAKQIRQALINILYNALEAMTGGGKLTVSVRLSAVSSQPSEKSLKADSCLLIAVRDTGPGIPNKDLQNLFIPFFTTKDGGTGLGLSVTRGIIEQHGGSLTARNHPEGGAEFTIQFPLIS